MNTVDVVTPTRDRSVPISFCQKWLSRQTSKEFRWILVDDGATPADCSIFSPVIHETPDHGIPVDQNSFIQNMKVGFHRSGERVIVLEDDDWISPDFVEFFSRHLDDYDLVSINGLRQYNVRYRRYFHRSKDCGYYKKLRKCPGNVVGVKDRALEVYYDSILECEKEGRLDLAGTFWKKAWDDPSLKIHIEDKKVLHVNVKGLPFGKFVTRRHKHPRGVRDRTGSILRSLVGDQDAAAFFESRNGLK